MLERPQLWRIPARLVADVLVDDEQFQDRDLWTLMDDLLYEDAPGSIEADDPRLWLVWLCSRYGLEQDIPAPQRRGERSVRDNIANWQTLLIRTPQGLLPGERADVGLALGRMDADKRSGVGLRDDGLPDIDWVTIPAGVFLMGSDKSVDDQAYDDETPQHEVELPTYYISRYPLTVKQYRAFMDAGGYDNRDYWTGAGWQWKDKNNITQPGYWQDERYNAPNQPVNGLSWYEAYAVTHWLNEMLTARPDEHMVLRLPTEQEWEKAARGTDGRIYPYGSEFDATKGNTSETGIGTTSAAGIFPAGKSRYGVLDMSGNLFDWCLTKWRNSYDDPEDNDPAGDSRRVLRGGAFRLDLRRARCVYRSVSDPDIQLDFIGVRVVAAGRNYTNIVSM